MGWVIVGKDLSPFCKMWLGLPISLAYHLTHHRCSVDGNYFCSIVPALISCPSPAIAPVCLCIRDSGGIEVTVFLIESVLTLRLCPQLFYSLGSQAWARSPHGSLYKPVYGVVRPAYHSFDCLCLSVCVTSSLMGSHFHLSLIGPCWGSLSAKAALCHLMPHAFLVQSSVGDFPVAEQRTLY